MYEAEWNGAASSSSTPAAGTARSGHAAAIPEQAERAVDDGRRGDVHRRCKVGATDTDEAVVQVLRKAGKPVLLVANKVDDADTELEAASLWSLGLGEPHCVSALHGRGAGDLLDAVVAVLPEAPGMPRDAAAPPCRAARQAERRQVVAAQPLAGRSASSSTACRHDRGPRRRADRDQGPELAVRRHRGHPPPGEGGLGPRVLRDPAHEAALIAPKWPSSCSTHPSRCPSRTCGSSRWSSTPAARSCWRSTSGTSSMRTAATISSARSSGTSCRCRGRRG